MSRQIGNWGEQLAIEYLQKQGYQLIAQKYHYGKAEIDLIAQKAELLVFVEVKLRKNTAFGTPETFVSPKQKKLIKAAAEAYMFENQGFKDIRFDIIAITNQQPTPEIVHFEDAFF
ncbi:MAG: YraN family protein [Microscillaceae bacterium]|jgi:putative endonuclease|nr:YraN family protein [Microscillaceae bacterium]